MNNLIRPIERSRSWDAFGDFDDLMNGFFRAPLWLPGVRATPGYRRST